MSKEFDKEKFFKQYNKTCKEIEKLQKTLPKNIEEVVDKKYIPDKLYGDTFNLDWVMIDGQEHLIDLFSSPAMDSTKSLSTTQKAKFLSTALQNQYFDQNG